MSFNQEFTIHPVGQGLFYSGKITNNSHVKFRMVFDCGSLTAGAGQEEVDIYRDADYLDKKVLDLLIISHFDKDHVYHIGKLLAGGIKVRKLVMPFINFSERLFLVAKHIDFNNGFDPVDDFFIRFVIDPLGTINQNLDGNSEIFLIENAPDEPINQTKGDSQVAPEFDDNIDSRFNFDFNIKEKIIDQSLTLNTELKIFKIKDTEKGIIATAQNINLMEFLFYRRAVGKDEEKFYEKVQELFFQNFSISSTIQDTNHLDNIISEVKNINSGTKIKKIFNEAKNIKDFEKFKDIKIADLNTTALSLLHKNLDGIFYYLGFPNNQAPYLYYNMIEYLDTTSITFIQKYISSDSSRIETQNFFNMYPYSLKDDYHTNNFVYPNVLLTSDSFLLTQVQVDEFWKHYKNHWDDFWLFQIPHHGSEKNSNKILHDIIPSRANNFINYGIGNRDNHPSSKVINSLATNGRSAKLISINQFSGIRFNLIIG
nr:hypothetical protein [Flavobacterium sp. ASV13]